MTISQITLTFVIGIITIFTVFGKIIFDYATLKSMMTSTLSSLTRIETTLSNQDTRIKNIEEEVIRIKTSCYRHTKEA